jgi:hypothetical protein
VNSTVRIWYENLAAMDADKRCPLSELSVKKCVHGGLRIEIAGRLVPYLGYFGPDDVCFAEWIRELRSAAHVLQNAGGRHVYDEGEQGQPAFVFERDGDCGFFSIAEAEFAGGDADPNWQRVRFAPSDLIREEDRFRKEVISQIRQVAPDVAEMWLKRLGATLQ